jgi:hypothetical protein
VIAAAIALAAYVAVKPGCGCANPATPTLSAPATEGPLRQMRLLESLAPELTPRLRAFTTNHQAPSDDPHTGDVCAF